MKYLLYYVANFFVLCLCCLSISLIGQSSIKDIANIIDSEFDGLRNGNHKLSNYHFDSTNENYFFNYLKKFENDPLIDIRLNARGLKAGIALQSKNLAIRKAEVEDLLEMYLSKNEVFKNNSKSLFLFEETDFSPIAKNKMEILFKKYNYTVGPYDVNGNFIMLCGKIHLTALLPQLKILANGLNRHYKEWYRTAPWYACLAATRMGDSSQIDKMIAAVELETSLELRVKHLLKQLAYTNDREIYKLFIKYLVSEEKMPKKSNHEIGFDFVNNYALDYLIDAVNDFPVKKTLFGYTNDDVRIAISWIKNKMN